MGVDCDMGFGCNKEKMTVTVTDGWIEGMEQVELKRTIKYYFFCLKWVWKNREWNNGRQKWKMMDRDYRRYLIAKKLTK